MSSTSRDVSSEAINSPIRPIEAGERPSAGATAIAEAPRRRGILRTFSSLRHRDFALLWFGSAFVSAGQWLQQITLSWLVYDITKSAFMVSLVFGLLTVPFAFIGPVSGVLADRLDRRLLLIVTHTYLFAITLAMAFLLLIGDVQVWHLLVFAIASGSVWAFIWPVRMAIIPALVPREELMNASALGSAAMNFTRIAGPAIGGALIVTVGSGGNFLIQAIFYGIMTLTIVAMRIPAITRDASRKESIWNGMMEGVRYVRSNEVVMTLLALGLITLTLTMPLQSLLPVFAGEVHDVGAGGLGLMMSFAGVGAFLGTLVVASLGDFPLKGRLFLTCFAAMGVWLAAFGVAPWLPLAVLFLTFLGVFQMTFMTIHQTLLQMAVTDEVRGRVFSFNMLTFGIMPLGTFAAGAMAEGIGAPATIVIMGILVLAIAIFSLLRLQSIRQF